MTSPVRRSENSAFDVVSPTGDDRPQPQAVATQQQDSQAPASLLDLLPAPIADFIRGPSEDASGEDASGLAAQVEQNRRSAHLTPASPKALSKKEMKAFGKVEKKLQKKAAKQERKEQKKERELDRILHKMDKKIEKAEHKK